MKGWVYVISNKAMQGLVKVGFSLKDPEIRARELGGTGSPHEPVVEYEVLVENPEALERTVHRRLNKYHEGKEWFRCSVEEAVVELKAAAGEIFLLEDYKHADRQKAEEILLEKTAAEQARQVAEKERRERKDAINAKQQEKRAQLEREREEYKLTIREKFEIMKEVYVPIILAVIIGLFLVLVIAAVFF